MKRNKIGSIHGAKAQKIRRQKTSGLPRFPATPVRSLVLKKLGHTHELIYADIDHDPRKDAREERKSRIAKNEKQKQQNLAKAAVQTNSNSNLHPRDARKREIERGLAQTRISTASMGRFDRQLDGEKKPRGIKRKASPVRPCAVFSNVEWMPSLILLRNLQMQKRSLPWRYYPEWKVTGGRCGESLSKMTWLTSVKLSGSRVKDKVDLLLQGKQMDGKVKSGKENGSAISLCTMLRTRLYWSIIT